MIKISLMGIIAVMIAVILKKGNEEYAIYISLATCIMIFSMTIDKLEIILGAIEQLQGYIKINHTYMAILIKIIGITYLTEFASSICKDCGFNSIGNQIEIVGKITILAFSMPILLALLETINSFLSV